VLKDFVLKKFSVKKVLENRDKNISFKKFKQIVLKIQKICVKKLVLKIQKISAKNFSVKEY